MVRVLQPSRPSAVFPAAPCLFPLPGVVRCFLAAGALLVAVALQGPALGAVAASATFVGPSGVSAIVRASERDGRTFLSVNDVVTALGGTLQWDQASGSYEVTLKGHSAVFGVESPVAVVDTRLVTLGASVRGEGREAWADPDFFARVLGSVLEAAFTWNGPARTLAARRAEVPEVGVEVSVADYQGVTKVVFRLSEARPYRVEKGEDQVLLRFPGVKLVALPAEKVVDDRRVARFHVRGSDAAVYLREKGLSANVYTLASPPRVVVDLTRAAATSPAVPGRPGALLSAPPPLPPARPEPKTVVLDPGHGGAEDGAKGPGGLLEKEATLGLAKAVREVLVRRGYRVVLTRENDSTLTLADRAAAANAAKADVFLSLHLNASRSATAHGTEVYYLSLDASDRAAAALAESENRLAARPTPTTEENAALRDLDLILWDLAQNQHLSASARLAEAIQGDLNRLLGVATRGVKQAPFRVLIGVNAPAVLVEVAFVSNAEEEKKLGAEEFRRQVAETLSGSLEQFFGRAADAAAPVPAPATPAGRAH